MLDFRSPGCFIFASKGRKHIHLKTDCDYECNLEKTMNVMRRFSVTSQEKKSLNCYFM